MLKSTCLIACCLTLAAAPFAAFHFAPPPLPEEKPVTRQGGIGQGPVGAPVPPPIAVPVTGSQPLGQGLRLVAAYGADGSGVTFYGVVPEPPPYFDELLQQIVVGVPDFDFRGPLYNRWTVSVLIQATQAEVDAFIKAYPDARVWGPIR